MVPKITNEAHNLARNRMTTEAGSRLPPDIDDAIERALPRGRTGHDGKNVLFLARSAWNGLREFRHQVRATATADEVQRSLPG